MKGKIKKTRDPGTGEDGVGCARLGLDLFTRHQVELTTGIRNEMQILNFWT